MDAKEKYVPVETPVGILLGRDAIYLDKINLTDNAGRLALEGKFNANLASKPVDDFIDYTITFIGIMALEILELDSWFNKPQNGIKSSFDEVTNSKWVKKLGGKVEPGRHKHFQFVTYDLVFNIVCNNFDLITGKIKQI